MTYNIIKLTFILTIFNFNNAFAYIDPFTGGFILQALAGVIATIIFYLGYPIRLIKKIFKKYQKNKNPSNDNK